MRVFSVVLYVFAGIALIAGVLGGMSIFSFQHSVEPLIMLMSVNIPPFILSFVSSGLQTIGIGVLVVAIFISALLAAGGVLLASYAKLSARVDALEAALGSEGAQS